MRCGRHLSEAFEGLLVDRVLLHDHDALCTEAVCETPPATGVRRVRAPLLADVNVHAEPSVRTIKESCVNRMIVPDHDERDHLLQGTNSHLRQCTTANRELERLDWLKSHHRQAASIELLDITAS
jgi:hypothetical protein